MRRSLAMAFGFVFGILSVAGLPARAQDYPADPVRVIVPYSAGGAGDVIGRLISKELEQRLGKSFFVDNRGGAGGTLAATAVARANPDGYTLFEGATGPLAIAPAVYTRVGFDPIADFAPISLIANTPYMLVVNPGVPAKTVAELIALLKAKPGDLSYGSAGIGGPDHLAGELFNQMSDTRAVHVPYKGAAPALVDVAAGRVQFEFVSPLPAQPLIDSGQLRLLAVTGQRRLAAHPDVPTVAETLPGFEVSPWYGLLAPKGTPDFIVSKLQGALAAALAAPNVLRYMDNNGLEAKSTTPEEFARIIAAETARWGALIRASKLAGTR